MNFETAFYVVLVSEVITAVLLVLQTVRVGLLSALVEDVNNTLAMASRVSTTEIHKWKTAANTYKAQVTALNARWVLVPKSLAEEINKTIKECAAQH